MRILFKSTEAVPNSTRTEFANALYDGNTVAFFFIMLDLDIDGLPQIVDLSGHNSEPSGAEILDRYTFFRTYVGL